MIRTTPWYATAPAVALLGCSRPPSAALGGGDLPNRLDFSQVTLGSPAAPAARREAALLDGNPSTGVAFRFDTGDAVTLSFIGAPR